MKIAVCLSGQSRTWKLAYKNILHFFDYSRINEDVQVDYFIHTWNNNNWRNRTSPQWKTWEEPAEDVDDIKLVYNPVYFKVETFDKVKFPSAWDGLFHSFMKTVHYKKKHELINNFKYDVVIKSRLDTIFNPEKIFSFNVTPLTIYSSHPVTKMIREFNYNNFSDVLFYADSPTMDIMANAYRYYEQNYNQRILSDQTRWSTITPLRFYGPGAILYDFAIQHGIYPTCGDIFDYAVVRRGCTGLDSVDDFEKIRQIGLTWYNNGEDS